MNTQNKVNQTFYKCDTIRKNISINVDKKTADYLTIVGYDVLVRQSDNLYYDTAHEDRNIAVIDEANTWGAGCGCICQHPL